MSATLSPATILDRLEHFGVKLGLERIRVLLKALESPHLAVPVVLVAGTNGKGSTASLLAAMTRAAGYRTGLFISPHLEVVNERISINGEAISDLQLVHQLKIATASAEKIQADLPTYFEAFTLAAFGYFRDQKADLAIFEVGLGGRLDATNTTEPIISLITSVDLDHQRLLGSTRAAVAVEKCGILRRDRPAFAWAHGEEVAEVLRERANRVGAHLVLAEQAVKIELQGEAHAIPQRATIYTEKQSYQLEIGLLGHHQLQNLALAVLASEELQTHGFERLNSKAISAGASCCCWAGRLEWVALPDGRRVLLDAAHNPAGAAALVRYLDHQQEQPPVLLFGALGDKRIEEMLPSLAERCHRVVLTRPPGKRGIDPESLLPLVENRPAIAEADLERALDLALEGASVVLVCGSLYLIGEIRPLLRRRFGVPGPVFPTNPSVDTTS